MKTHSPFNRKWPVRIGVGLVFLFGIAQLTHRMFAAEGMNDTQGYPSSQTTVVAPVVGIDAANSSAANYPPVKQTYEQKELNARLVALKTPLPPPASLKISPPQLGSPSANGADVSRHPAGIGTIVESGQAPFPSIYGFENRWFAQIGNKIVVVYAGALYRDSDTMTQLDSPWPGVLVVNVIPVAGSADTTVASDNGVYWTPIKDGPARIVDANGMLLTIITDSGASFVFDVASRQFLGTQSMGIVQRQTGRGVILENPQSALVANNYRIENQWYEDKDGVRTTILAGSRKEETGLRQAVLLILVTSPGQPLQLANAEIYPVPHQSVVRIVRVDNNKLVLTGGYEIVFDIGLRQFISPVDVLSMGTPTPAPTAILQPTVPPRTLPAPTAPSAYP